MREPLIDPTDDTPRAVREVLAAAYRRMTPSAKLERARQLTLAVSGLALEGARRRRPDAPRSELLADLARIRLGEPLATAAANRMRAREP